MADKKKISPELEEMLAEEKKFRGTKPGSLPYVWHRLRKSPTAMAGIVIIVAFFILSFLSPYFMPYSWKEMDIKNQYALPSLEHWLGCDEVGRDILSRLLYGARYTLSIGIFATAFSAVFGIVIGAIAGYYGGLVDDLIMRGLDVFQSFPQILLAIAIAAVLGPGYWKIILAMGITGIPGNARMMRANILTVRGNEYVEAASSINCSTFRVIFHHVIPNAISPLIISIAQGIASAGLQASSLSFLGFGVQAPLPEWGAMLSSARKYIRDYPHMVIIPGIFLMVTVLAYNLIGDAVRDALDPKLKE